MLDETEQCMNVGNNWKCPEKEKGNKIIKGVLFSYFQELNHPSNLLFIRGFSHDFPKTIYHNNSH